MTVGADAVSRHLHYRADVFGKDDVMELGDQSDSLDVCRAV